MYLLPQLNKLDLFAQLVSVMLNSKTQTKMVIKKNVNTSFKKKKYSQRETR